MKLVKDINKCIKEELARLDLTPEKPVDETIAEQAHYFYTSRCVKSDKTELVFKARIIDDYFIQKAFENEITGSLFFMDQPKLKKYLRLRDLYDWGMTARLDWAVYEFAIGKHTESDEVDQEVISKIVQAIKQLQSIDVSILPPNLYYFEGMFTSIKFNDVQWWDNRFERYYKIVKAALKTPVLLKRDDIRAFFKENYKILRYAPEVLAHGDFDIPNILRYNGIIQFIDWERVMVTNQAYDLANIFTRGKESWRADIIKAYLEGLPKIEDFKILWRLMVILQCIYKIVPASQDPQNKEAAEIKWWLELINKSLSGFEELIK